MYEHPHELAHRSECLTEADNLFCQEDDGQIMLTASSTDQICLTIHEAYALGCWLIAAAARIETRFPEMVGGPFHG
jgi:hypothetical protein